MVAVLFDFDGIFFFAEITEGSTFSGATNFIDFQGERERDDFTIRDIC